jgi:hypothetical protein
MLLHLEKSLGIKMLKSKKSGAQPQTFFSEAYQSK